MNQTAGPSYLAGPALFWGMPDRITEHLDEEGRRFVIRAPAEIGPDEILEAAHHQFILTHWEELAAASLSGYRQAGKGVLIVGEATPPRNKALRHSFMIHRLAYAAQDALQSVQEIPSLQWLLDQVERYDPHQTVLLLFTTEADTHAYAVEGDPPPPDALLFVQASNN